MNKILNQSIFFVNIKGNLCCVARHMTQCVACILRGRRKLRTQDDVTQRPKGSVCGVIPPLGGNESERAMPPAIRPREGGGVIQNSKITAQPRE